VHVCRLRDHARVYFAPLLLRTTFDLTPALVFDACVAYPKTDVNEALRV
jgi:hypothetical protein